jgi:diguanylate cyclase (GGDEF)-like protein
MQQALANPFERLVPAERRAFLVPASYIAILVELIVVAQVFNSGLDFAHRLASGVAGVLGIAYTWLLLRFVYPHIERFLWIHWLVVILNGIGLGTFSILLQDSTNFLVDILAIMGVTVSAILSGRWLTYGFIFIITAFNIARVVWLVPLSLHEWVHLLGIPLVGFATTETALRLGTAINSKVKRLETINSVSRKIASTIEVDQVISLVSAAVQEALHADTYYVGLVQGDCLRLDLFYDDGEFFLPGELPLKGGLAGWVLENRKSLLLSDVPKESQQLGIPVRIIGKPKTSLSWMGVPMLSGNHLIGLMAMASYQANAFDRADLDLLENVAHQAALAIDNAYHHAEVKRQSQLDSLTQVYNHGNLLAYLAEYATDANLNQTPLSLIMLDVDFFKQYNDAYGHQVGDQALNQVVAAVRQNVRSSDIVGRWGGEEFAVILPETQGRQAMQVAERIRLTLRSLTVKLPDGRQVPPPTVSQGIATFSEAPEAERLVDLADRRLYIAKARGRDQVEPGEAHWDQLKALETT